MCDVHASTPWVNCMSGHAADVNKANPGPSLNSLDFWVEVVLDDSF